MESTSFLQKFNMQSDGWEVSENISNFDLDFLERHPELSIACITILATGTCVGVMGNILVICSIIINAPLRKVGNMFIINLALSDILVIGFINAFNVLGITLGPKFFIKRLELCGAIASICLLGCFTSLYNVVAVSINRYILICKNHIYKKVFTPKRTFCYLLGLWITCLVLTVCPHYIGWGGITFDLKVMACSYDRSSHTTQYLGVLAGVLPTFTGIFYIKIWFYVRQSTTKIMETCNMSENGKTKRRQDDIRLTITLFIIWCTVFLSWIPYTILIIADSDDEVPKIVYIVTFQLAHLNSALNPIIYGIANKDINKSFKITLEFLFCCKRRDTNKKRKKSAYIISHLTQKDG